MDNHSFEYTYSARRQQEVEEIRKKYLPQEEDKMDRLRRLHAIPTQKAQAASIAAGVIGALILGFGMSLCMTDLGAMLGIFAMILGSIIGVGGGILAALAYPIYKKILKTERRKIAPKILQLSEELMN